MSRRVGASIVVHSVALTIGAGAAAVAGLAAVAYAAGLAPWPQLVVSLGSCGAVLLLAGAAVAWLAARETVRDVQRLVRGIGVMVRDEAWGEPVAVPSRDELGQLTLRLERLRRELLESLQHESDARRRAEEADRFKTEFLTTVSHELRTPLNSILGFTDVLLEEIEGPLTQEQREDLQTIRDAGTHLASLFTGVLELSAAASGDLRLERGRVELPSLLRGLAAELHGQLQDRPLRVYAEVSDELAPVYADPTRLRQVLTNLGSNALKFTEQGEVVLGAEELDDRVRLWVRDTGPGIPSDQLETIFEEFGQAGRPSRKGGVGLGLAIGRQLVELHGSELTVDTTAGRGTTFAFTMPRWRAGSKAP